MEGKRHAGYHSEAVMLKWLLRNVKELKWSRLARR
jgi:hypothetical protein